MNVNHREPIATRLRAMGPYLLAAVLLPGGLIGAPLVWLYRRCHKEEPK